MKLLSDIDVSQKRVFVRADLDVPFEQSTINPSINSGQANQQLTIGAEEATRLTNLKPTVDYLLGHGASKVIIAGHIDRPSSRLRNGKPVIDPKLSTKQLLPTLEKILGRKIEFIDQFPNSKFQIPNDGQIFLLENLRFWPGEVANDPDFAKQLAGFSDIYINEAFGNCHRKHASMVTLPQLLPHAAGLHLAEEVNELSKILKSPKKPFVAIVGGAKIETKLPLVEHLSRIADFVLVGGEIAKELSGYRLQTTAVDSGQSTVDKIIVATLTADTKDIDEKSIDKFKDVISTANTVVWNGPLGLFEEGYDKGSKVIARAIIDSPAYEVVGGGETVEFLAKNNLLSKFSFVSSGGGAMLEFLAGKTLPALKALE